MAKPRVAISFAIGMLSLSVLSGCCMPLYPADGVREETRIVGNWEGTVTLEDNSVVEGVSLEFAATSLVSVDFFGICKTWVTRVTLREEGVFAGTANYAFSEGVASVDGELFSYDVVFGQITASLTLSQDGNGLSGPISYETGPGTAVTGTLTATRQ